MAEVILNILTTQKQGHVFKVPQMMLSRPALDWMEGGSRGI